MLRDIDQIIERLKTEIPGLQVTQLQVTHPGADDDGLWFIKIPGRVEEVQIESSYGSCPFIIESDFSAEVFRGSTVDEVVSTVKRLYLTWKLRHRCGKRRRDEAGEPRISHAVQI